MENFRHFWWQPEEETGPWVRKTATECSCVGDESENAAARSQLLSVGLPFDEWAACHVACIILQHLAALTNLPILNYNLYSDVPIRIVMEITM